MLSHISIGRGKSTSNSSCCYHCRACSHEIRCRSMWQMVKKQQSDNFKFSSYTSRKLTKRAKKATWRKKIEKVATVAYQLTISWCWKSRQQHSCMRNTRCTKRQRQAIIAAWLVAVNTEAEQHQRNQLLNNVEVQVNVLLPWLHITTAHTRTHKHSHTFVGRMFVALASF